MAFNKKRYEVHMQIIELKRKLRATDYIALKYAEGEISAGEYAATKEQRKAWRAEINALEAQLKQSSI